MAFLEVHLLKQFPPSLINRGEDGSPKACFFGGTERQRWSSQSQKRTMRQYFRTSGLVAPEHLAVRTKRLPQLLTDALVELGHAPEEAGALALNTLWGANLLDTDPATADRPRANILLFLGYTEAKAIARAVHERAGELLAIAVPAHQVYGAGDAEGKTDSAEVRPVSKKDRQAKCPKEFQTLGRAILRMLDPATTIDLALFGRMIATAPGSNVDGALCVAHAFSANRLIDDIDFFTAVDDEAEAHESGIGHIGNSSLTSSTLYQYMALNLGQLHRTLGGDRDLTETAINACWQAIVHAQPTAKATSTAPFTRPSLVLTVVRTGQPLSLANGLTTAIQATRSRDVSLGAAVALNRHWELIGETYGHEDVVTALHTHLFDEATAVFPGKRLPIAEHGATAAARAIPYVA